MQVSEVCVERKEATNSECAMTVYLIDDSSKYTRL